MNDTDARKIEKINSFLLKIGLIKQQIYNNEPINTMLNNCSLVTEIDENYDHNTELRLFAYILYKNNAIFIVCQAGSL